MIKLTDPGARFRAHKNEYDQAINRVLGTGNYLIGSELEALEVEFAQYIGARACVGVANATDGIEIALRSAAMGPGDEVITVSMTAGATVSGIINSGATPVLIDVERNSRNMNPELLEGALSPRTRAVMPVHLYGRPARMEEIKSFCRSHGLLLIEDCSQAHGAKVGDQRVGSIGDIGVFSCYPTKNLGAFGDAGLLTFSDVELAASARAARQYGWRRERNLAESWGRNSRLDEVQAAVLRVGLRHLDEENKLRQTLARLYFKLLNLPGSDFDEASVWHLFVLEAWTDSRADLIQAMTSQNVQIGVHYPHGVHQQYFFKNQLKFGSPLTVTERLTRAVVSLPLHPYMKIDELEEVITQLNPAGISS